MPLAGEEPTKGSLVIFAQPLEVGAGFVQIKAVGDFSGL
jgi:hypothetical protein